MKMDVEDEVEDFHGVWKFREKIRSAEPLVTATTEANYEV